MGGTKFCRRVHPWSQCPTCGSVYSWVGEFEVCVQCLNMFCEEVLPPLPSRYHQEAVPDDETETETETGDLV